MLNCENDLTELLENEEGTVHVQVAALQDQQQAPPAAPPPPPPPSLPRGAHGAPALPRRDAAAVDAAAFDADQQFLSELHLATGTPVPPSSSFARSSGASAFAGGSPPPAVRVQSLVVAALCPCVWGRAGKGERRCSASAAIGEMMLENRPN